MAISLTKGGNLSLTKAAPGITRLQVGLGWDLRATDGAPFDLDASAFLLTTEGKARGTQDFVFYNQLATPDGSVVHQGDNRTGEGEGDDEVIVIDLQTISADVAKVAVTVTIHEAAERRQNFGMVNTAFIRCVNLADNVEIARYDLTEDASLETSMIFGEIYRHSGEWKFRAVGQGFQGDLGQLAAHFGVQL